MAEKPLKFPTPEAVIRKRRSDLHTKDELKEFIAKVVFITLAVWFLFSFVFAACRVSGMTMFPAIKDGDLVVAYRLNKKYKKDDVVVFEHNGKNCVGRAIAFENDTVTITKQGVLTVNGTRQQSDNIVYNTYPNSNEDFILTVPQGKCFILCDNREKCEDSRDFGSIPMKDVKGKVISVFRRRGI